MNVKFSFDRVTVDRRGLTLEDVYQTIRSLFAAHGFPCISDDGVLVFEGRGYGGGLVVM